MRVRVFLCFYVYSMKSSKYIADRIRLMIATKQFQVGEKLPSTRELGRQLDASFHTVRKAYGILADEGLISSEKGSGYKVIRQSPNLSKSERLEIGAEKLASVLEELIGYGLDDQEIEEIFFEQLNYMEWPDRLQRCITLAETEELATILANGIKKQVGVQSHSRAIKSSDQSVNYDAVFVPLHLFPKFSTGMNKGMIIPIIFDFSPAMLMEVIEHAALDTIGIITTKDETIPHLINQLKRTLQFEGSFLAGTLTGTTWPHLVNRADLILYSPLAVRTIKDKLPGKKSIKIEFDIAEKSVELIRSSLWDQ